VLPVSDVHRVWDEPVRRRASAAELAGKTTPNVWHSVAETEHQSVLMRRSNYASSILTLSPSASSFSSIQNTGFCDQIFLLPTEQKLMRRPIYEYKKIIRSSKCRAHKLSHCRPEKIQKSLISSKVDLSHEVVDSLLLKQ